MASPSCTHLIVTYNSGEEVLHLLGDLRAHSPGRPTVVIDNASLDGTVGLIESQFPEAQLVRNRVNVGYATAVNQGFGLSATEYVFLLNPDIRIESAAVFQELQRCLESEPDVAVAGPLQLKDDGKRRKLNFTWSYLTPRALRIYIAYLGGRPGLRSDPIPVSFLNAGCLFIRRSAFDAVGRLNEKYFLYGEEPDLFLKLRRYGYGCRLLPAVSVIHGRERSLRSVPSLRRLWYRLIGVRNIIDAVARGLWRLAVDKISGRGRIR